MEKILARKYELDKYKEPLIRFWCQLCENSDNYTKHFDDYNSASHTIFSKDQNFIDYYENVGELSNGYFSEKHGFSVRKKSNAEPAKIYLYKFSCNFLGKLGIHDKARDIKKGKFKYESLRKFELDKSKSNNGFLVLDVYFLKYNNIVVPISQTEGSDLIEYYEEARRRDDLEELYRKSTYIPYEEYKEFLEFKEYKTKLMSEFVPEPNWEKLK